MIGSRNCTKCSEAKPLSEFYLNKNGRFGVQPVCSECTREYAKEYRNRPGRKNLRRLAQQEVKKRSPEVWARRLKRQREYRKRPEVKRRLAAYQREYQQRPGVKERIATYQRSRTLEGSKLRKPIRIILNGVAHKECTGCLRMLPLNAFYQDKSVKFDGRRPRCIECLLNHARLPEVSARRRERDRVNRMRKHQEEHQTVPQIVLPQIEPTILPAPPRKGRRRRGTGIPALERSISNFTLVHPAELPCANCDRMPEGYVASDSGLRALCAPCREEDGGRWLYWDDGKS